MSTFHLRYYKSHVCRFINVFVYIATILKTINCRETSSRLTQFQNIYGEHPTSTGFIESSYLHSTEKMLLESNYGVPSHSSKSSFATIRRDYNVRTPLISTFKSLREEIPIKNKTRLNFSYVSNINDTNSLYKFETTNPLRKEHNDTDVRKHININDVRYNRSDLISHRSLLNETVLVYQGKNSYGRKIEHEIDNDEWKPSFGPKDIKVSNFTQKDKNTSSSRYNTNYLTLKNLPTPVVNTDNSLNLNSIKKENRTDFNNIHSSFINKIHYRNDKDNRTKHEDKIIEMVSTRDSFDNYISQEVNDLIKRNIEDEQLLRVFNCIQNFNLVQCLKVFLLERLKIAVRSKEDNINNTSTVWFEDFISTSKNFTEKNEKYENKSDTKIDTEISNSLSKFFHGTKLKFRFLPGISLEKLNESMNSFHIVFRMNDTTAGNIEQARKKKMSYLPLLLVPPLLMSSVIPFIIPGLKMMALIVSMLNQMAFMSALFSIVRGFIFDAPKSEKVIYINEGYKNKDKHNVHYNTHPANIKFYGHYTD